MSVVASSVLGRQSARSPTTTTGRSIIGGIISHSSLALQDQGPVGYASGSYVSLVHCQARERVRRPGPAACLRSLSFAPAHWNGSVDRSRSARSPVDASRLLRVDLPPLDHSGRPRRRGRLISRRRRERVSLWPPANTCRPRTWSRPSRRRNALLEHPRCRSLPVVCCEGAAAPAAAAVLQLVDGAAAAPGPPARPSAAEP